MQRFFVSPETVRSREVKLSGEVASQIRRVLRMRPGDQFMLLDGLGFEYRTRVTDFGKDVVFGEVLEQGEAAGEPACSVDIYLSILNKPEKFEWALQKCTELGAARFVPVVAERSVSGVPAGRKLERWDRIIQEAAEQSGRAVLPRLDRALAIEDAYREESKRVKRGSEGGQAHVAVVPALGAGVGLGAALAPEGRPVESVSLFIGPEGGFTQAEVQAAEEAGLRLVTLGSRTLRAETAAVAALAVVMHELGEMGTARGEE